MVTVFLPPPKNILYLGQSASPDITIGSNCLDADVFFKTKREMQVERDCHSASEEDAANAASLQPAQGVPMSSASLIYTLI